MAQFNQAPLPFIGQKRNFINHFKQILNDNIPNQGEGWILVDAFGGSGLLSHTAKQLKPKARVIYNDFDGYTERLKHIDEINQLRQQLATILSDYPRQKRLPNAVKTELIATIDAFRGYKDPHILCAWLLFSGQQITSINELSQHGFYNCIRRTDYPNAREYLTDIEIINNDFKDVLTAFKCHSKTVLILDPPYLCTHQASYKQQNYFDLIDFLELIQLTRPPYIFFSSTKSEFIRFIDWMVKKKVDNWQTFDKAKILSINTSTSYSGKYEDNMVFKFE